MNSDVKLDGDHVIAEARVLRTTASDFMLDNPGRREEEAFARTPAEHRRALVHDVGDRLTINYGNDYLKVKIVGRVEISDVENVVVLSAKDVMTLAARAVAIKGSDLLLEERSRRTDDGRGGHRRALVHDVGDKLTINYAHDYPGGVAISGPVEVTQGMTVAGEDVQARFRTLERQVEILARRLDELEGR